MLKVRTGASDLSPVFRYGSVMGYPPAHISLIGYYAQNLSQSIGVPSTSSWPLDAEVFDLVGTQVTAAAGESRL